MYHVNLSKTSLSNNLIGVEIISVTHLMMEEFFVMGVEISILEEITMYTSGIKFCIFNTSSSPQPSR